MNTIMVGCAFIALLMVTAARAQPRREEEMILRHKACDQLLAEACTLEFYDEAEETGKSRKPVSGIRGDKSKKITFREQCCNEPCSLTEILSFC